MHACSSMQVRTYMHTPICAYINTRTQRHARTPFLNLGLLGFDKFYKKKIIYHCMLIGKCNNYDSK